MKLYNHWIKFNKANGEYDRTDETRDSWVTNRSLAERRLKIDVVDRCGGLNNRSDEMLVYPVDCGIKEKEFASKIEFEGLLHLLGSGSDIAIGNKTLYRDLYEKFHGNKVRLTIEILENDLESKDKNVLINKIMKYCSYGEEADVKDYSDYEINFLLFLLTNPALTTLEEIMVCWDGGHRNIFYLILNRDSYDEQIEYIKTINTYFKENKVLKIDYYIFEKGQVNESLTCILTRFKRNIGSPKTSKCEG